jgi:hypothetical protein
MSNVEILIQVQKECKKQLKRQKIYGNIFLVVDFFLNISTVSASVLLSGYQEYRIATITILSFLNVVFTVLNKKIFNFQDKETQLLIHLETLNDIFSLFENGTVSIDKQYKIKNSVTKIMKYLKLDTTLYIINQHENRDLLLEDIIERLGENENNQI